MSTKQPDSKVEITWQNVGIAFSFLVFDSLISGGFGLNIGPSLLTAGIRCIAQLALVATILQKVFEADHVGAVFGIALLLNVLATFEIVVNKSKYRTPYMAPSVLFAMLCSTIPVSIIGARFAMGNDPFWLPSKYIPLVGLLCGATMPGMVIGVSFVHKELDENKDKTEAYLAFGASRMEACRPIAREALRLALTPTVTQMSVIGIIAIPGMMTGAILGGASVEQASKLQMIIMFMISSSTALATMVITMLTLILVIDNGHRVRPDRMDGRPHIIWRARDRVIEIVKNFFVSLGRRTWRKVRGEERKEDLNGESERLMHSEGRD